MIKEESKETQKKSDQLPSTDFNEDAFFIQGTTAPLKDLPLAKQIALEVSAKTTGSFLDEVTPKILDTLESANKEVVLHLLNKLQEKDDLISRFRSTFIGSFIFYRIEKELKKEKMESKDEE